MIYVLRPLSIKELERILDDKAFNILNYLSNKAIFAQPELIRGQEALPLHIPKEHIEQWIIQAIGGESVGAGNYPVDIIYKCNEGNKLFGIDIVMVSAKVDKHNKLKNTQSGETSLAQYFQNINGKSLDHLFDDRHYQEINDFWKTILTNKYEKVKIDYSTTDLWLLFVIRAGTNLYLGGTEIILENIQNMQADEKRSTESSVFIDNIIQEEFGSTKIYRAKKRLELRLYPKYWYEQNYLIKFNTNEYTSIINLRELESKYELENHTLNLLNKCNLYRYEETNDN